MANISSRIKELRKQAGLTGEEFGKIFGIVKSTVSLYENGKSTPDDNIKQAICNHFNISLDYLMGNSNIREKASNALSRLTPTDEQDIAFALEDMMRKLSDNDNSISFNGHKLTDEGKDMLRIAIENSLRVAKQMTKQKDQNK